MKRIGISSWWLYTFVVLIGIFLLTAFSYAIGGNGIKYLGSTLKFDRNADYQMFKVNDEAALIINHRTITSYLQNTNQHFRFSEFWENTRLAIML